MTTKTKRVALIPHFPLTMTPFDNLWA